MKRIMILLILLTLTIALPAARKALVIGNAAYEPYPLNNPVNDAVEIAKALQRHSFAVTVEQNLDKQGFYRVIGQFAQNLVPGDEAVFFYSGHGVQLDGRNYLIPVREEIDSPARVQYLAYDCSMLLKELETAAVSVVILDACRNNPFSFHKSMNKGLATVQTAPGTQYIVHSTGAGKTADDGEGNHSPFTEALLTHIDSPRKITDLIQVVTDEVARKTMDNQIPWSSGNLRRDFYIAVPDASVISEPAPINTPAPKIKTEWYFGSLRIESNETGDLFLNDKPLGKILQGSAVILDSMVVGEHYLRVTYMDKEITKTITISKGQEASVNFEFVQPQISRPLEKLPEAQSPSQSNTGQFNSSGTGDMIISSDLSGDLYIDGIWIASIKKGKLGKVTNIAEGLRKIKLLTRTKYVEKNVVILTKKETPVNIGLSEALPYFADMVLIKGGEFVMGSAFVNASPYELPKHKVIVSDFLIQTCEVNQNLWTSVSKTNPSQHLNGSYPVTGLSWFEAIEFCNALSEKQGFSPCYSNVKAFAGPESANDNVSWQVYCDFSANGFRLPTEAEWEYAARAGDTKNRYSYSGGTKAEKVAWIATNAKSSPRSIGTKPANDYGLYDMSGNVYEWCWDYFGDYPREKQSNPRGPEQGTYRVVRGGGWLSTQEESTVTHRSGMVPDKGAADVGLRLVRSVTF